MFGYDDLDGITFDGRHDVVFLQSNDVPEYSDDNESKNVTSSVTGGENRDSVDENICHTNGGGINDLISTDNEDHHLGNLQNTGRRNPFMEDNQWPSVAYTDNDPDHCIDFGIQMLECKYLKSTANGPVNPGDKPPQCGESITLWTPLQNNRSHPLESCPTQVGNSDKIVDSLYYEIFENDGRVLLSDCRQGQVMGLQPQQAIITSNRPSDSQSLPLTALRDSGESTRGESSHADSNPAMNRRDSLTRYSTRSNSKKGLRGAKTRFDKLLFKRAYSDEEGEANFEDFPLKERRELRSSKRIKNMKEEKERKFDRDNDREKEQTLGGNVDSGNSLVKGKRGKFNKAQNSRVWLPEEDELMIHLKEERKLSWEQIAMLIPRTTRNTCQMRYLRHYAYRNNPLDEPEARRLLECVRRDWENRWDRISANFDSSRSTGLRCQAQLMKILKFESDNSTFPEDSEVTSNLQPYYYQIRKHLKSVTCHTSKGLFSFDTVRDYSTRAQDWIRAHDYNDTELVSVYCNLRTAPSMLHLDVSSSQQTPPSLHTSSSCSNPTILSTNFTEDYISPLSDISSS